jgi:hypothetical protein
MTTTFATTPIVAPTTTLGDLAAIMADLTRTYPEAGARVQHGAFLALMGHAESDTATGWWVTSERDGETQYFVLPQYGSCTCQDHARHGHLSPCKHRLCVETLARLERLTADREQADILDVDQPIDLELSPEAYELLDLLGEPCDVPALCPECGAVGLPTHVDHLCRACLCRELCEPEDPAA